jgi:hypothetical protein
MRIVLVLGAGATLAQAMHLREQGHSGERPPLDTTFFDRIAELDVDVTADLHRYATRVLGADPFEAGSGRRPGMEAFFKDAFYDLINDRKRGTPAARAYGSLLVAYRSVLLKTTNWMHPHMSTGPVPTLLKAAATRATDVDVITFNHDLVLENALAEIDGLKSRWCLRHGYGAFAKTRTFTSPTTKPFNPTNTFRDARTCKHPNPIRVFKLHGSLNWYVDSDSPVPEASVLRGEPGTDQRIRITRQRQVARNLHYRSREFSWPVLIPPVYAKQAFIRNFMSPVWDDARRAVADCERVVFFGYSMPPLDIEAEKEFQRAIRRNSMLPHIDVVNPDPSAAGRYAEAFPSKSVHWHPDLRSLLKHPSHL